MASSAGHLDAATQQLAASLARVTGAPVDLESAPWADIEKGVIKLLMGPFRPEEYARLFDPGFLQFILVDPRRTKELWDAKPSALSADLRTALAGVGAQRMSAESKTQFEQQIAGALARLDPARSLGDQVGQAPRLAELMVTVVAATKQTGSAPDEFWELILRR